MFVLFLLHELCRSGFTVEVEAWTWVFDIDVRKQKNDVVVFLVKLCIDLQKGVILLQNIKGAV